MSAQSVLDFPDVFQPVHRDRLLRFSLSPDIVLASDVATRQAEVLGSLRTQLIDRHLRKGRRAIALCSPSAKTGVSFMAANLAFAFAQMGANTLLVDANMRCPAIQNFVVPHQPVGGLCQCLAKDVDFTDQVQANVIPHLSVLYSGGPDPQALEKLSGPLFQPLIAMWMRDFDMVIVDTPPANQYADLLRIASAVGHALIVLRKHVSYMSDADRLIAELTASGVGITGIVLNER